MDRNHAIRLEQARSLHDGIFFITAGNLGGALSALLILSNSQEMSKIFLAVWMLTVAIFVGWTFVLRRHFSRTRLDDPDVLPRWFHWSIVNYGILGAIWGGVSVSVMLTGKPELQFAMLAGISLLMVSAISGIGVHLPTYQAFLFTILMPTILALLAQWTILYIGMGLVTIIFAFYMVWCGNRFNASYIESLRLRFENMELVKELTLQKEAAETANLAKSRFLAAASHDLRQPMYALNLYHGAMENSVMEESAQLLLANARQCAMAMDDMFSVLLDMSNLDAGAVLPTYKTFPVMDLLERIRIEFEPAAKEKGLELRVIKSSCSIYSDSALAERIVRNFVSNAVRYTQRGTISVGCRRVKDSLRVAVIDTGTGIPQDKQREVFEEYFQLANPERDRSKGLGLGLAIVTRLANLLKAPISMRSELGRGSMFAVDFPRVEGQQALDPLEQRPELTQGDLSGWLIVVIDDEFQIRDALGTLLRQWGCNAVVASSGDEAVEQLAMSPVVADVIICDYRLRGTENGLDAIEKVRMEFCSDIPALLVTGDTAPDQLAKIMESGIAVLHKPLQPQILRAALLNAASPLRGGCI